MNQRFRHFAFICVISLVVMLGACSRGTNQPVTTTTDQGTSTAPSSQQAARADKALVRMVNAIPGTPSVDAFANDQKTFESVAYKTVTPYKELPDRRATFRVVASGNAPSGKDAAEPLAENREGLSGGGYYTVVALPARAGERAWEREERAERRRTGDTADRPTEPRRIPDTAEAPEAVRPAMDRRYTAELRVFTDDLTAPSEGKAKVRIINAADVDEVSLFGGAKPNDALIGDVNFGKASRYHEVDTTAAALTIRTGDGNRARTLANIRNANLEPGKIYTFVIAGKGSRYEAIKIEDQLVGTTTAGQPASREQPRRSAY